MWIYRLLLPPWEVWLGLTAYLPPVVKTGLPEITAFVKTDLPDLPLSSKRIYRIYICRRNGFTGFTSVVKMDLPDLLWRIYWIYRIYL